MRRFSILILVLLLPFGISAEVYTWVDENGVVHYSDSPPPSSDAAVVDVPQAPPGPSGEAAAGVYDAAIAELEARRAERAGLKAQERAARAAREEAEARDEAACSRAIHYLAILRTPCPVFYDGAGVLRAACPGFSIGYWEGERSYVDDDERARLVAHYETLVERCRQAR
jgi:hypothetical protein